MDKIIVAKKSNFSIITWVMGIVLMIILILVPNENELANKLSYLAYVLILYFTIKLFIHLIKPNVLIERDDEKLYISKTRTVVEIEPNTITNIEFKASKRRDVNYDYGKLILTLKNGQTIKINSIARIEEVKKSILSFIRKK